MLTLAMPGALQRAADAIRGRLAPEAAARAPAHLGLFRHLPGAELADMVRNPLPQVNPFPERFGYDRTVPGILDIIDVDRYYQEPRSTWFSGGPAGYSGSSRNSLGSV